MLGHMRTTLNVNEHLLSRARALAQRRGETLTSVFEEALAEKLAREERGPQSSPEPLPVFRPAPGREGLVDGVTLDSLTHELP
jgi:hypothetical protein